MAGTKYKVRPAESLEARENQLISLAVDLAEQQLRDGTASSQVITHFLKLGSTREKLEKEILSNQAELTAAKTENIRRGENIDEMYKEAVDAMQEYKGNNAETDEDEFDYDE